MTVPVLSVCPGTLAEGFNTYSPACLRRMFDGKKVNHVLPYVYKSERDKEQFLENRKRLSISGVQEKLSLTLEKNRLRLTEKGEQGQYILKPIPVNLKNVDQVPANEHLTMQIAKQVYRIPIAENAMIFFEDGLPAYLTRRFDIRTDGMKRGQEDFASLAGKTSENSGKNFKYSGSYEDCARLIKKFVPAYPVEMEKFFSLVVFNYLFSNGDAHLKNFSLSETIDGDYVLSPAYDLICTAIHVNDSFFALNDGLFSRNYMTPDFEKYGFYSYKDFREFGIRIGLAEKRLLKILQNFSEDHQLTNSLINRSFLDLKSKQNYKIRYQDRLRALNTGAPN